MKKNFKFLICSLLVSSLCALFVSAQNYDASVYRMNDYVGVISEEEVDEIDDLIISKLDDIETDLPICVFDTLSDDMELREYADAYYEHNNYGYGENKDGIFLVFDMKNRIFAVYYYGEASNLVSKSDDNEIIETIKSALDDDEKTNFDVFCDYVKKVSECVKAAKHEEAKDDKQNGMPYWYADDVANFENFHAENPKKVVDDAGILTPAQEAELSAKIQEIVDKYGFGYVLFTDKSTHGLSKEVYSADFLYYNGYGTGENYSAVCFFLSLEEGNRGWRTTSINDCERIFTSDVCYEIDELVDSDMRAGNYYTAFKNQIEYTEKLFEDISNPPEWYPEGTMLFSIDRSGRKYAESPDLSKPRVVDDAGLFTTVEKADLTKKINEIVEKHGYDFVIFTDNSRHALRHFDYACDYYYYNGYAKDGAILFITNEGGYLSWITALFGEAYKKLSKVDMDAAIFDEMSESGIKGATDKYLENLDFAFGHGRFKMSTGKKVEYAVIGVIAGLIIALVIVQMLKKKMVIKPETSAMEYLVPKSFVLRSQKIKYLYSTVTKTAKQSSSGSSGSSGGSSYSSGSSSSGGSYSSGGRDF